MKSSRLVDILDVEDGLEFWNKIFAKMNTLLVQMESKKGNYDIDDPEIRWVSDRIEYWNNDKRKLNKSEMLTANTFWKKYK
mgnify:FL=1|tara:strand:+ start:143 stop:385 length:243 start_codon:yes stop_codon:yes gene_type:complete